MRLPACRICGRPLERTFVDLGMSPLCETFLTAAELDGVEHFYPLHVRICDDCLLVQLEAYVPGEEIFREYAYFSAFSDFTDFASSALGLMSFSPRVAS